MLRWGPHSAELLASPHNFLIVCMFLKVARLSFNLLSMICGYKWKVMPVLSHYADDNRLRANDMGHATCHERTRRG